MHVVTIASKLATLNHVTSMSTHTEVETLKHEVARLESQLLATQVELASITDSKAPPHNDNVLPSHPLLLLSDSALPLGSFAFSSGLESYLAHHNTQAKNRETVFPHFLTLTLTSLATTTLPYLLAAYKTPLRLQELDETLDACTLCPVARRASVAQGKALLTLWERALKGEAVESAAKNALEAFSGDLKRAPTLPGKDVAIELSGHFAPVWAAVTSAVGVTLRESAYTFLFSHAKAVVSAAVRASVMGPYAAQGVLASVWLRGVIERTMSDCWEMKIKDAGQGVPMCDLWVGRHELLYSRIFNS